MKKIILTGGGTAGHVIPALALVDELKTYFDDIYYMGERGGVEEKLAKEYNLEFFATSAVKFKRDDVLSNLKIPKLLHKGIKEAKEILKKLKPDVIFAKGGYVSLPTALAGSILKIPLVIHESDISLGLANRVCLPFAKTVLTSFEKTYSKGIYLGNPIRREILQGEFQRIWYDDKKVILVMGGSKGSKTLNNFITDNIDYINQYNIIHIVGNSPTTLKRENYYSLDFTNRIQDLYQTADVIVTRGGANSLSELTALGKPTLVIPLPKGASRGDQVENAIYYRDRGYVDVLFEEELSLKNFKEKISVLLNKKNIPKIDDIPNTRIVKEILKTIE